MTPQARAALANDDDWQSALDRVLAPLADTRPDVLVLFASHHHANDFPELVHAAWRRSDARILVGCSGVGVIGMDRELEREPGLAALALSLPNGKVAAAHLSPEQIAAAQDGGDLADQLGIARGDVNGWLAVADPRRLDGNDLIAALGGAYPGTPIVGGFASPGPASGRTALFLNGELYPDGAVVLAIGGAYELLPVVSQGSDPIGETWTITSAQAHWIETISNRPAAQVLAETLNGLPEELRSSARRNLLIGLAADEYRTEYLRGDFLVRNLAGIDQGSGAIAVGAAPRIGQTIQFQMRDAATADLDLTLHLEEAKLRLGRRTPAAGLLFTCNGRGEALFGRPHHDALAISRKLGGLPLAGLFCAGEFGPAGGTMAVHGFTASLALIVPTA